MGLGLRFEPASRPTRPARRSVPSRACCKLSEGCRAERCALSAIEMPRGGLLQSANSARFFAFTGFLRLLCRPWSGAQPGRICVARARRTTQVFQLLKLDTACSVEAEYHDHESG